MKAYWANGPTELGSQIDRHFEHLGLDNAILHSHRMVPQIARHVTDRDSRILCVGACNMIELYTFMSYGFRRVIGIDLVSNNRKSIKIMDMHEMKFGDSSSDVIYVSGALHCTYAIEKLVREFIRVIKHNGLIAITVPVKFAANEVYRYDPVSIEAIESQFSRYRASTIWSELDPAKSPTNPNANDVARVLMRIQKATDISQ